MTDIYEDVIGPTRDARDILMDARMEGMRLDAPTCAHLDRAYRILQRDYTMMVAGYWAGRVDHDGSRMSGCSRGN